jgi:hypothetical protein
VRQLSELGAVLIHRHGPMFQILKHLLQLDNSLGNMMCMESRPEFPPVDALGFLMGFHISIPLVGCRTRKLVRGLHKNTEALKRKILNGQGSFSYARPAANRGKRNLHGQQPEHLKLMLGWMKLNEISSYRIVKRWGTNLRQFWNTGGGDLH